MPRTMKVMALADIREFTDAVTKLTSATKATGPKTERGKLRSALNATRHGLAGRGLLLPGEDAQVYTEKMDGIFTSMAPQDDAQAELVALVADDVWKLGRLAKIEKGVTLGRIEELLALTGTAEKAGVTSNAITALGTALATWSAEPIPVEKNAEFSRRLRSMVAAVNVVEATMAGIPADLLDNCNDLIARLHGVKGQSEVDQAAYVELFEAARQAMGLLLDRGHAEEAAQDELRANISGIALPDEAELKKLARYRKMLEDSLQRRLTTLDQLRKIAASKVSGEADMEKAKEYRVRLRVVA
jgi:hypothetical protein